MLVITPSPPVSQRQIKNTFVLLSGIFAINYVHILARFELTFQ